LYDKELFDLVSQLYAPNIALYKKRCEEKDLLNISDVCSPILDIYTVELEDVKYSFDVNFLRDEALRLESTDLKLAPNLIALAYQSRPNGPVIKEKHNEYKNLLDKYNEEDV
jgi:hypothetical protein